MLFWIIRIVCHNCAVCFYQLCNNILSHFMLKKRCFYNPSPLKKTNGCKLLYIGFKKQALKLLYKRKEQKIAKSQIFF